MSCIDINVSGYRFTTSLTTLRRFPNSLLGTMFSGNYTTFQMADGSYFIDRDGTHFSHILNFLRDPEVQMTEMSKEEEELKKESKFYCLTNEMFPILTACKLIRSVSGFQVSMTQDKNGIWYQNYCQFAENKHFAIKL